MTTLDELSLENATGIEMTEAEQDQQKYMKWGSIAIKCLVAFYTVPHNMTAFDIDSVLQSEFFGILVFEVLFVAMGIYMSAAWYKGQTQKIAVYATFYFTAFLMAMNTGLSFAIHRIDGIVGVELIGFWGFYQDFIVGWTPILVGILTGISVGLNPNTVIASKKWSAKVGANIRHLNASIKHDQLMKKQEQNKARSKAQTELLKLKAKLAKQKSDNEIYLAELQAETNAQTEISKKIGEGLTHKMQSEEFKEDIGKVVDQRLAKIIRKIKGMTARKNK